MEYLTTHTQRVRKNRKAVNEILTYLNYKHDSGLLKITHIDVVDDGVPLVLYEVLWSIYRASVLPEFERLCRDFGFRVEIAYCTIAKDTHTWARTTRRGFAPNELVAIQVLLHERRNS